MSSTMDTLRNRRGTQASRTYVRRWGISAGRRRWSMSLNLTPMIDIVFLLIFFFMLVSQFRRPEGVLPAQLPAQQAGVSVEIPRAPLRIRLSSNPASPDHCQASIDKLAEQPMPIAELTDRLSAIQSDVAGFDASTPIHLLAADGVRWDHVVNAYNAILSARYDQIYFVETPDDR